MLGNKNFKKNVSDKELKKWLGQKCDCSDNIFDDPGYTDYYKKHFGIHDEYEIYYKKNDIDEQINIGYEKNFDNEEDNHLTDAEKYVDYVPEEISQSLIDKITCDMTGNEKLKTIQKLTSKGIIILPGSNHSNANYMYKIIKDSVDKMGTYEIPDISPDPTVEFKGENTNISMKVDKVKVYKFIYRYSDKFYQSKNSSINDLMK